MQRRVWKSLTNFYRSLSYQKYEIALFTNFASMRWEKKKMRSVENNFYLSFPIGTNFDKDITSVIVSDVMALLPTNDNSFPSNTK